MRDTMMSSRAPGAGEVDAVGLAEVDIGLRIHRPQLQLRPGRSNVVPDTRQLPAPPARNNLNQRRGQPTRPVLQLRCWAGREALVHPLGGDIPRLIVFLRS